MLLAPHLLFRGALLSLFARDLFAFFADLALLLGAFPGLLFAFFAALFFFARDLLALFAGSLFLFFAALFFFARDLFAFFAALFFFFGALVWLAVVSGAVVSGSSTFIARLRGSAPGQRRRGARAGAVRPQ